MQEQTNKEFFDIFFFFIYATLFGNSTSYSRWKYGKTTHMRDIPHWLKCMLECHMLGNEVKTNR